jgi:hypothetical protein
MFSRKKERKVLPSTDDHAPSAAHNPQPLDGAKRFATSVLAAESGMKVSPPPDHPDLKIHLGGQTVTSSPKEGEQIEARIPAQDAASTASKDANASKPSEQMLSDWKRCLGRSASYAGSLKSVGTRVRVFACSTEFDRRERKLIYKTGVFKYTELDRHRRKFGTRILP